MNLITCNFDDHAEPILAILNDAILNSTVLFDYKPRTLESMATWFKAKAAGDFPVIGMADDAGQLLGFASYGTFRANPAYQYTVEHSVYVQQGQRGRGIGLRLLQALIQKAKNQDYHCLVGVIESTNSISIALHQKLGFSAAGQIRQSGYKFGQWLDVSFYQLILETPEHPNESGL